MVAAPWRKRTALSTVIKTEDGNLPAAQIADAPLKAFEAHSEMTEAARRLYVFMPTGAKGARRPAILP
jgi:hypothetical protein